MQLSNSTVSCLHNESLHSLRTFLCHLQTEFNRFVCHVTSRFKRTTLWAKGRGLPAGDPPPKVIQFKMMENWIKLNLGRTGGPSSELLRQVQIPIFSPLSCRESYKGSVNYMIDDSVICAGSPEGGKDFCTVRNLTNKSEKVAQSLRFRSTPEVRWCFLWALKATIICWASYPAEEDAEGPDSQAFTRAWRSSLIGWCPSCCKARRRRRLQCQQTTLRPRESSPEPWDAVHLMSSLATLLIQLNRTNMNQPFSWFQRWTEMGKLKWGDGSRFHPGDVGRN